MSEVARLTERQLQVAFHLSQGQRNKKIALILKVSEGTIEKHRSDIMERLGVSNVAGITSYIISIKPPPHCPTCTCGAHQ